MGMMAVPSSTHLRHRPVVVLRYVTLCPGTPSSDVRSHVYSQLSVESPIHRHTREIADQMPVTIARHSL